MLISMQNICDSAGINSAQRKFVEGTKILEAEHNVKCGMNVEKCISDVSFTAVCLQTSQLREKSHEINTKIFKNGKIKNHSYIVWVCFVNYYIVSFKFISIYFFYDCNNNI